MSIRLTPRRTKAKASVMTVVRTQESIAPRIYLARHGRTALNAAGVLRGRLDPPLDELGQQQAFTLADLLDARGINLIIASPLHRTVATASPLAARLGLDVEIDTRLLDRDYGKWAGRVPEQVIETWGSIDAAPGVEPIDEVVARAWAALRDAAARSDGRSVLLVSHEAVNQQLVAKISPALGARGSIEQDNGCVNTFRFDEAGLTIEILNQTATW